MSVFCRKAGGSCRFYSYDFNTTSFNWWMETAAEGGQAKLDEWIKENNISFPVGTIEGDSDKVKFTWGVKSLSWLVLTDKRHIVVAEGFNIDDLEEKITESGKK
ncbi:MAG: hypothetical protein JW715_09825 [Sedimentisphaerales bacterium]|nr:hypothetical protein [Sedimentisphaerales bacterium]